MFHAQRGLVPDGAARLPQPDGMRIPRLLAVGGAGGISGPDAGRHLFGNSLLTATVPGRLAGTHAAAVQGPFPA